MHLPSKQDYPGSNPGACSKMITLTESAIKQIKKIVENDGLLEPNLRIKVMGGGCAGFQYDMYFEEYNELPTDEVFVQDGIKIMIDPLSLQYLDNTTVDFLKEDFKEGFKFLNPNVTATCGCGSSFK